MVKKDCDCKGLDLDLVIQMMEDQERPYQEFIIDDLTRIRWFDHTHPEHRFKWHWDEEDRQVKVLNSAGWRFQFDNQLPIEMVKGMEINIQRGEYHRIIPGRAPQKLKIKIK